MLINPCTKLIKKNNINANSKLNLNKFFNFDEKGQVIKNRVIYNA